MPLSWFIFMNYCKAFFPQYFSAMGKGVKAKLELTSRSRWAIAPQAVGKRGSKRSVLCKEKPSFREWSQSENLTFHFLGTDSNQPHSKSCEKKCRREGSGAAGGRCKAKPQSFQQQEEKRKKALTLDLLTDCLMSNPIRTFLMWVACCLPNGFEVNSLTPSFFNVIQKSMSMRQRKRRRSVVRFCLVRTQSGMIHLVFI